jgi:plasmid stabilization system protein ParE
VAKKEKTTAQVRKIRVLDEAYTDIENIIDFIAQDKLQPLNAIKVGENIFATLQRIYYNPFVFKECAPLTTKAKMYRQASCLSWLIIYKITSTEIIILGVIHSARSPSRIKKFRKIK